MGPLIFFILDSLLFLLPHFQRFSKSWLLNLQNICSTSPTSPPSAIPHPLALRNQRPRPIPSFHPHACSPARGAVKPQAARPCLFPAPKALISPRRRPTILMGGSAQVPQGPASSYLPPCLPPSPLLTHSGVAPCHPHLRASAIACPSALGHFSTDAHMAHSLYASAPFTVWSSLSGLLKITASTQHSLSLLPASVFPIALITTNNCPYFAYQSGVQQHRLPRNRSCYSCGCSMAP